MLPSRFKACLLVLLEEQNILVVTNVPFVMACRGSHEQSSFEDGNLLTVFEPFCSGGGRRPWGFWAGHVIETLRVPLHGKILSSLYVGGQMLQHIPYMSPLLAASINRSQLSCTELRSLALEYEGQTSSGTTILAHSIASHTSLSEPVQPAPAQGQHP